MDIALWIAQVLLGFLFLMAGFMHGTRPVASLAPQAPWTAAVPLPLLRFIGLAEALGGLGVILAQLAGQSWLAALAATGLALVMLLAAGFHATRREYPAIGVNLVLGALAVFVAYGRFVLLPAT
jgi:putative oxidoreductase